MSQGGLMSFGESLNTKLSFTPEAVIIASIVFSLLIIMLIKTNFFGL